MTVPERLGSGYVQRLDGDKNWKLIERTPRNSLMFSKPNPTDKRNYAKRLMYKPFREVILFYELNVENRTQAKVTSEMLRLFEHNQVEYMTTLMRGFAIAISATKREELFLEYKSNS